MLFKIGNWKKYEFNNNSDLLSNYGCGKNRN